MSKKQKVAPDQVRLRRAVMEIRRSADLRFFIRTVLTQSGLFSSIPVKNALETAHFAGKHELGLEIQTILLAFDSTLFADLLAEDILEREGDTTVSYDQETEEPSDEE